jgi:hypothetical protein
MNANQVTQSDAVASMWRNCPRGHSRVREEAAEKNPPKLIYLTQRSLRIVQVSLKQTPSQVPTFGILRGHPPCRSYSNDAYALTISRLGGIYLLLPKCAGPNLEVGLEFTRDGLKSCPNWSSHHCATARRFVGGRRVFETGCDNDPLGNAPMSGFAPVSTMAPLESL